MDGSVMAFVSTLVLAIVGAVGTAIKLLWSKVDAQNIEVSKALTECREEHKIASKKVDTLTERMLELTGSVANMKGRIEGYQEAKTEAEKIKATSGHPQLLIEGP